jgi:RHS repeat-associated protein
VELKAMDYGTNWVTNTVAVTITNNGSAKTLTYDLNGNLTEYATSAATNTYEWDATDRLVKISRRPAGGQWNVTQFAYDGMGRRVRISETTNNSTTTKSFMWSGTELCEERNSSGGTVNRRFFEQGEQISTNEYVFTRDHLGSVREMISSGGTIQARYEYDPHGRRTKISGSSESDFGYTGHYYHQKSGSHLALFRVLDNEHARWISRDPLGEQEGANLYSYVANDALNFSDPYGLAMNEIQQKLLLEALNVEGSTTHIKQLKKYDKDHRYDPKTGRAFRVDLADKHHEYPHVHIFKSVRDVPKQTDKVLIFDPKFGSIRRAGVFMVLGTLGLIVTAQASAAEIIQTVSTIGQDCRNGRDDWAYVGLLTYRHQVNQLTGFMGDAAMRQMSRQMDECQCR